MSEIAVTSAVPSGLHASSAVDVVCHLNLALHNAHLS